MKTEITTKELEEAMNAVLKQARKMEESDEPEERRYGFGMEQRKGRPCDLSRPVTRRKGRQHPRTAAGEQGAYRPRPSPSGLPALYCEYFLAESSGQGEGECPPRRATRRPLLSSANIYTRVIF